MTHPQRIWLESDQLSEWRVLLISAIYGGRRVLPHLGDDQLLVDLHAETGTLRQIEVAFTSGGLSMLCLATVLYGNHPPFSLHTGPASCGAAAPVSRCQCAKIRL